jgi:hypothetical protein
VLPGLAFVCDYHGVLKRGPFARRRHRTRRSRHSGARGIGVSAGMAPAAAVSMPEPSGRLQQARVVAQTGRPSGPTGMPSSARSSGRLIAGAPTTATIRREIGSGAFGEAQALRTRCGGGENGVVGRASPSRTPAEAVANKTACR